ncbi:MAG: hypothetical protein IPJ65_35065 [Archangiaceae bacterium]|nr:hypothetical protein [Archangiaceae bacterium]
MNLRAAVTLFLGGVLLGLWSCSAPAAGCTKDTDCKDTRVCVAGECVERGTGGGAAGGSAGGSAGGTAGGSAGGTAGGSAGGTAGGSAGGTAGGSAGGTAGGSAGGAAGGAPTFDAGCNVIGPQVAENYAFASDAGWGVLNRQNGMSMLGCAGAANTRACLSAYPSSTANAYSSGWAAIAPGTTLRILGEYAYVSSYWTRSSPDGRFIAHGGGVTSGATVHDLVGPRTVAAAANYQPNFFPDNSGFSFQTAGGHRICRQSLLTSNPTAITFSEPECSTVSTVGLHSQLAAETSGGGYWAAHGAFNGDNGMNEPSRNFSPTSALNFTPLVFNGSTFVAGPTLIRVTPDQGDVAFSPSARIAALRKEDGGYALRQFTADGGIPVIAHYCSKGALPSFSFDERFITYHHWVESSDFAELGFASAADAAFVALVGTSSNIYVIDLLTGYRRPITRMSAGQHAVFPHFRSDGWVYFVVKDVNRNVENIVASDAVLP